MCTTMDRQDIGSLYAQHACTHLVVRIHVTIDDWDAFFSEPIRSTSSTSSVTPTVAPVEVKSDLKDDEGILHAILATLSLNSLKPGRPRGAVNEVIASRKRKNRYRTKIAKHLQENPAAKYVYV